jgi:hypothetical protein
MSYMAQKFRDRADKLKAEIEAQQKAQQEQEQSQQNVAQPATVQQVQTQFVPVQPSPAQDTQFVDPMTIKLPEEYTKAQQEQEVEHNKYKEENERLLKEIESLKKAHDEDLKAVNELAQYKKEHAADEYIKSLGDLGTISADDARRIVTPLIERSNNDLANITKQLNEVRDSVAKEFSDRDSKASARKQAAAWKKVGDTFPDLSSLQNTPVYREIMSQPIGAGVGLTVGTLVATELNKGNADYAIEVLKNIKARVAGHPASVSEFASVNTNAPTGGTATSYDSNSMSLDEIADLNYLYKTKQIDRKTFVERRQKYRAGAGASSSI